MSGKRKDEIESFDLPSKRPCPENETEGISSEELPAEKGSQTANAEAEDDDEFEKFYLIIGNVPASPEKNYADVFQYYVLRKIVPEEGVYFNLQRRVCFVPFSSKKDRDEARRLDPPFGKILESEEIDGEEHSFIFQPTSSATLIEDKDLLRLLHDLDTKDPQGTSPLAVTSIIDMKCSNNRKKVCVASAANFKRLLQFDFLQLSQPEVNVLLFNIKYNAWTDSKSICKLELNEMNPTLGPKTALMAMRNKYHMSEDQILAVGQRKFGDSNKGTKNYCVFLASDAVDLFKSKSQQVKIGHKVPVVTNAIKYVSKKKRREANTAATQTSSQTPSVQTTSTQTSSQPQTLATSVQSTMLSSEWEKPAERKQTDAWK